MKQYNKSLLVDFLQGRKIGVNRKHDFLDRKSIDVSTLIISFDIETTSTYIEGNKIAYMYEWSMCFMDNEQTLTVYGRYWQEWFTCLQDIKELLALRKDRKKAVIWVHNLGYEFQFFRKYFKDLKVFAVKDRTPIKVNSHYFIFRDTLILSAMSLSKVADNLTSHKIKKLTGDLDYKLVRNPSTPMSKQELAYCENDVLIVCYYIAEQLAIYGTMAKIPLTNTGRVRELVRDNCFYTSKNHQKSSKGKYQRYHALMKELTIDSEQYPYIASAFAGGFTHANYMKVGDEILDVHSIDFTSSY